MASRDPVVSELLSNGVLNLEQVESTEQTLARNLENGQQALAGTEWRFDQSTGNLEALSYPDGDSRYSLSLPRPQHAFNADNWEASGSHITLFHPETFKKVEDIPWRPSSIIRLQQAEPGLFVGSDSLSEANLPLTQAFLTQAKPRQAIQQGPFDLFFGPGNQALVVADRAGGKLHHIDLAQGTLNASWEARSPGSSRGLNVNFSGDRLITADNTSSLSLWNLDGSLHSKVSPGAGLIGTGVLAPDGRHYFAVITKPAPALKVIDLQSGSVSKEIAIKGDLYSVNSDAPTDLITLSPDGSHLLLMTYLNEPEPFTPIISVIDVERQKTTQRFAIKDGTRPSLLTFLAINPLAQKNQTVVDLLLAQELITADDLHKARLAVREKEQQAIAQEAAAAPLLDLDQRNFEEAQREQEEAEEAPPEGTPEKPVFKPEKAPQMNISPVADELITAHCTLQLLRESQGEIDLQNNPDLTESLQRLQAAATRARHEIEWHTGAIIKLKQLVGELNFETVITREQMEQMLHRHERDSLVSSGMPTVPSNCPNCAKPLFGSYLCSYCGYEIERPEELLKRGLISIASAKPLDNLVEGHFLLIDIEGKRILEVDTDRTIAWSIGKDILSESTLELQFPRDAVRTATRNTLITDYSQNRVVEITPSGRMFWEYQGKKSAEHALSNPVRATANGLNHVLIADQGRQRVIEVDRNSDFLLQYGHTDHAGIEEGMLNMPSDVQRLFNGNLLITDMGNHRVIEIEDGQIIWQYGNPDNLSSGGYSNEPGYLCYPQAGLRLDNGNTLIVDAGNMRLIEINAEREILWEHRTNEGPEEQQMDSPFRAAYLPSGLVMLLSETSVLEIDPVKHEVVWSCQLSEFERAKAVLKPEQSVKRFMKHGVRNPYYTRAKAENEGDPSADAQNRIQELIAKRLATSRTSNSNKAHISTFGKSELVNLDFFLVDRSKNRVFRTDRDGNLNWRFGENPSETLNKPHACTRTPEGRVLVADTDNHRILEIDPNSSVVTWQFGKIGQAASGAEGVNRPRFAQVLDNGHILIADQYNRRVFELTRSGQVVWTFEGMDRLTAPYHAQRLDNGNTLITDWGAHEVFEVTPKGDKTWSFGERKTSGPGAQHLSYPEHAVRLDNGNTLITDTRNDRVIEVNPAGELIWKLEGHGQIKFGSPSYTRRLPDGHTLVIHSSNRQILEVDERHQLFWKFMLPFERPAAAAAPQA